jgi:hypothetical protein
MLTSKDGDIELVPSREVECSDPAEAKTVYLTPLQLHDGKLDQDIFSEQEGSNRSVSHMGEEIFHPSSAVPAVHSKDTCQAPDKRTAEDGLEVIVGEPSPERSSGMKRKEIMTAQFPVYSHNAPILGSPKPGRPTYLLPTRQKLERELSQGHERTRTISREIKVPQIMQAQTEYSGMHSLQSLSIPQIIQAQSAPDHFRMHKMQASFVRDSDQYESQRSYGNVHQDWQQAYSGIQSNMRATASEIRASPDLSVPMLATSAGMVSPAAGRRTLTSFQGNTPIIVQTQGRGYNTPDSRRTTDWERALELLSSAFAGAQSQAAGAHMKSRGNVVDQPIEFSTYTTDHTAYTHHWGFHLHTGVTPWQIVSPQETENPSLKMQ